MLYALQFAIHFTLRQLSLHQPKCTVKFVCSLFISYTDKYVMHPSFQSFNTVNIFQHLIATECGKMVEKVPTTVGWIFFSITFAFFPSTSLSFVCTVYMMHAKQAHLNYLCIYRGKPKKNNNRFYKNKQTFIQTHTDRIGLYRVLLLLSNAKLYTFSTQ